MIALRLGGENASYDSVYTGDGSPCGDACVTRRWVLVAVPCSDISSLPDLGCPYLLKSYHSNH